MPLRSLLIQYVTRAADIRQDIGIIQRKPSFTGKDKILADLRCAALAYDRLVAEEEGRL